MMINYVCAIFLHDINIKMRHVKLQVTHVFIEFTLFCKIEHTNFF